MGICGLAPHSSDGYQGCLTAKGLAPSTGPIPFAGGTDFVIGVGKRDPLSLEVVARLKPFAETNNCLLASELRQIELNLPVAFDGDGKTSPRPVRLDPHYLPFPYHPNGAKQRATV